ncbi:aspartate aminotransferase family protein [Desulfurispora thermophila]|uniref:aspartate aminotransferase family protein n=1 Tax=Desulfurispora thermophila TaxID=265470 RepID=UPI0003752FAA|nr:aspartate aminotransferase family protein [Desulfurispora thermophila]
MTKEQLISLDRALQLTGRETAELHRRFGNEALAKMLGLLKFDKRFVRAQGVRIWDEEGNEYLDFLGSYGAMNTGHNHPAVLAALARVQDRPNLLQAALNPLAGALAHNLAQLAPGNLKRSFFCNSGAEAVEGALKTARLATGRPGFIYCQGSFHGKSFGALSVTGREKYQQPFAPLLAPCQAVPFGDLEALRRALASRQAAAFIVEPVQGEGGVHVPPPGYLKEAARLCREHGTLFIADEIQTGLGRTGALFACQAEEVEPDILCLAKSLGGGVMPMGAFLCREEVWQKAYGSMERATLHTSTFGGNTLACAAALATLQVLQEENLAGRAAESGAYLLERLRALKEKHRLIRDVRGRGLLIGVEFEQPGGWLNRLTLGLAEKLAAEYTGALVAGLLLNQYRIITAYTLNNPNVIRLEPPLTVGRAELDAVVTALDEILSRHKGLVGLAVGNLRGR